MREIKLVSAFVLLVLLLNIASGMALAQGPGHIKEPPRCSDMPDAQIPGTKPGSACRVPVAVAGKGMLTLDTVYRSGWTHTYSSESDSDLVEDSIKVEAWLYWVHGEDNRSIEDDCEDPRTYSSHAGCRTFGSGGGSGSTMQQDGYHYFHKSGYVDENFQTQDTWTI